MNVFLLLRLKYALTFLVILMACTVCVAQQCEQIIHLEAGWNAIYLEVSPEIAECNSVFSGIPIESVWMWDRRSALSITPFSQEPQSCEDLKPDSPWLVFFPPDRPEHVLTTLHRLIGGKSYLIKVKRNIEWVVQGIPQLPRVEWISDSYNLVGFNVGTEFDNAGQGFVNYFSGSLSQVNESDEFYEPVYELQSGRWEKITVTSLERGKAYWIYSEGTSGYTGPLGVELEFGRTIQFLGNMVSHKLTLTNRTENEISVNLSFDRLSEISSATLINGEDLTRSADKYILTLEPNETDPNTVIILGLNRTSLADSTRDILHIESADAKMHFDILVEAEPASVQGLWAGVVNINAVSDVDDPTVRSVLEPFQFRLLLYVEPNGVTRLLNEVIEVGSPPISSGDEMQDSFLNSERTLYSSFSCLSSRGGIPKQARRISSAAFSFATPQLAKEGLFDFTFLEWDLVVDQNDPRHPYVHKNHPDHKSDTAREITRNIKLLFSSKDASEALGWGDTWISGIYEEEVKGVIRSDRSIKTQGRFMFKHINRNGTLIMN
ncbi:hypothetical protein ACFL6U_05255 [Planctomycetota bacterium]